MQNPKDSQTSHDSQDNEVWFMTWQFSVHVLQTSNKHDAGVPAKLEANVSHQSQTVAHGTIQIHGI